MMLILFVALFIGVWAADSIQKDLSSLKSDVQRAAADLIVGSTINIQDDLWDISARLGKSTQTLKQYSTIPDTEAALVCTDFTSLDLVPLVVALQSYAPRGTPFCFSVSAVKVAFEYYGGEFIARLKDKFICQEAVEVAREVMLILDDAVQLVCDH
ncbi:hypothetical protein CPB85DRAFT_1429795 [Mucidula mucida]|nr:hypothetical protein CPB85DRAFT_1429795 [Mucidula mucida]